MHRKLILPGQYILTEIGKPYNRRLKGDLLTSMNHPDERQYLYGIFNGLRCVLERNNTEENWTTRFDMPRVRSGKFTLAKTNLEIINQIKNRLLRIKQRVLLYEDMFPPEDSYPGLDYRDTLIVHCDTGLQLAATNILFDGCERFYKFRNDMDVRLRPGFPEDGPMTLVEGSRCHTVEQLRIR